jgi:hypothetical protein
MKKLIALPIIALGLTACETSEDSAPVQSRVISVELNSPSAIELLDKEREGSDLVGRVIKVYDNNGYPHFLRTDGYQVVVNDFIDGIGAQEVFIPIEDISNAEPFEVEITGEAEITLIAPEDFFDGEVAYSYTAIGTEKVSRDTNHVVLKAEYDPSYSYVTIRASEDIDRENTYVNDAHLAATLNEDGSNAFHTVYIKKESQIEITTTYGATILDTLAYDAESAEHYPYDVTGGEDGGIIIVPPQFGEPIVISPVDPIITKSQVAFAEIIDTDSKTGAVTLLPKARGGKPSDFEATIKTVVGKENLGTIGDRNLDFTFDLLLHSGAIQPYVNIYVDGSLDDKPVKTVSFYGNGSQNVTVRFADGSPDGNYILDAVAHLAIINQLDNNGKGNFWVRLNDDDKNAGQPITINSYNFSIKEQE